MPLLDTASCDGEGSIVLDYLAFIYRVCAYPPSGLSAPPSISETASPQPSTVIRSSTGLPAPLGTDTRTETKYPRPDPLSLAPRTAIILEHQIAISHARDQFPHRQRP